MTASGEVEYILLQTVVALSTEGTVIAFPDRVTLVGSNRFALRRNRIGRETPEKTPPNGYRQGASRRRFFNSGTIDTLSFTTRSARRCSPCPLDGLTTSRQGYSGGEADR